MDAQVLLTQCQECVRHLELIADDADACRSLDLSLSGLTRRAQAQGFIEIGCYAERLQALLAPACQRRCLPEDVLPLLRACLSLLAWQLELVDRHTGRLNLDSAEQEALLAALAERLGAPSH